ncbi:MAG: acylphosphatase, partial [archaeon]
MKRAVRIIVSGTVQGVFFRQFCKEKADGLGLRGFVRNLTNGDVEIIIEGEEKAIKEMVEICRVGPRHSLIRDVQIEERKYSDDFKDFKALRM